MYWAVDVLPHTHSALTCTLLTLTCTTVHDALRYRTARRSTNAQTSDTTGIGHEGDQQVVKHIGRAFPATGRDFLETAAERRLANHLGVVRNRVGM